MAPKTPIAKPSAKLSKEAIAQALSGLESMEVEVEGGSGRGSGRGSGSEHLEDHDR
jgi:hypothetical protein